MIPRTAVALAAALLLAGCGVADPHYTPTTVPLPDGREVLCIRYKQGNAGGLSCDWAGTR